jgi:ABC-type branched-subunit amino acid transport system permease subunit
VAEDSDAAVAVAAAAAAGGAGSSSLGEGSAVASGAYCTAQGNAEASCWIVACKEWKESSFELELRTGAAD